MTQIIYRNGELVADRLVVEKHEVVGGISQEIERVDSKLFVTEENDIAYVFNNDQFPDVLLPVFIYIRRFEKGLIKPDEPELVIEQQFKMVAMTKRHFYSIDNSENKMGFRIGDNDLYIAPNGSYRHYECLRLTAEDIYKVMSVKEIYMQTRSFDKVTQQQLTLIKKGRK